MGEDEEKALKFLTSHFQSFLYIYIYIYIYIHIANSKTSKVNQQSVSNLYIFHHFPKSLDWTIMFNSVTLKNT